MRAISLGDEPIENKGKNIPTKTDIRDDTLKIVTRIMEYVLENEHLGKVSEQDIKNKFPETKFGKNNYWVFHKFCGIPQRTGESDKTGRGYDKCEGEYAITHCPSLVLSRELKKPQLTYDIELTAKGIHKLFELKKTVAEEERNEWIKWATIVMAVFAGFQAIPYIWPQYAIERCCIFIPVNLPVTVLLGLFLFFVISRWNN